MWWKASSSKQDTGEPHGGLKVGMTMLKVRNESSEEG